MTNSYKATINNEHNDQDFFGVLIQHKVFDSNHNLTTNAHLILQSLILPYLDNVGDETQTKIFEGIQTAITNINSNTRSWANKLRGEWESIYQEWNQGAMPGDSTNQAAPLLRKAELGCLLWKNSSTTASIYPNLNALSLSELDALTIILNNITGDWQWQLSQQQHQIAQQAITATAAAVTNKRQQNLKQARQNTYYYLSTTSNSDHPSPEFLVERIKEILNIKNHQCAANEPWERPGDYATFTNTNDLLTDMNQHQFNNLINYDDCNMAMIFTIAEKILSQNPNDPQGVELHRGAMYYFKIKKGKFDQTILTPKQLSELDQLEQCIIMGKDVKEFVDKFPPLPVWNKTITPKKVVADITQYCAALLNLESMGGSKKKFADNRLSKFSKAIIAEVNSAEFDDATKKLIIDGIKGMIDISQQQRFKSIAVSKFINKMQECVDELSKSYQNTITQEMK